MSPKLPSRYPPELPIAVASRLAKALNMKRPSESILFGSFFPKEIWDEIISRKTKSNIGDEMDEIGFYAVNFPYGFPALVYRFPEMSGEADVHEGASLALHVFALIGFREVIIIDGVNVISADHPEVFVIDDHVNLTGINPLEYWMKPSDPNPFFLDVKNLYIRDDSVSGENIHLAVPKDCMFDPVVEAEKARAVSYGAAFCPESIIAGYLGMSVRAIGVSMDGGVTSGEFEEFFSSGGRTQG